MCLVLFFPFYELLLCIGVGFLVFLSFVTSSLFGISDVVCCGLMLWLDVV